MFLSTPALDQLQTSTVSKPHLLRDCLQCIHVIPHVHSYRVYMKVFEDCATSDFIVNLTPIISKSERMVCVVNQLPVALVYTLVSK